MLLFYRVFFNFTIQKVIFETDKHNLQDIFNDLVKIHKKKINFYFYPTLKLMKCHLITFEFYIHAMSLVIYCYIFLERISMIILDKL